METTITSTAGNATIAGVVVNFNASQDVVNLNTNLSFNFGINRTTKEVTAQNYGAPVAMDDTMTIGQFKEAISAGLLELDAQL